MSEKPNCPTCMAIVFPGMTVELTHCAGIAIGINTAGAYPNDPLAARREIGELFCRQHADLIFGAARVIADGLRMPGLRLIKGGAQSE